MPNINNMKRFEEWNAECIPFSRGANGFLPHGESCKGFIKTRWEGNNGKLQILHDYFMRRISSFHSTVRLGRKSPTGTGKRRCSG